jgi:hypothetical protein
MKNSLRFTPISGTRRHAEFDSIRYIRPIMVSTNKYYSIHVTGVVYTDTGETVEVAQFGLFTHDYVTYRGKTYEFENLDRLCMVVENENNLAVLEAL